jgi:AraC family transcriptional regulator
MSAPKSGVPPVYTGGETHYAIENFLQLPSSCLEVRKYSWVEPIDDVWVADRYVLDLSLSPRQRDARAIYDHWGRGKASEPIGRLLFVPPGYPLRSSCSIGTQRSLHCIIEAEIVDNILGDPPFWDEKSLKDSLHLNGHEIEWLLLKTYKKIREGGFAVDLIVESLVNILAAEICRRFQAAPNYERGFAGGLPPWKMRVIRERAHASGPAPTLSELADLSGLTVRHLSRAFKEETGQTIGKFVESATIERARDLLADTKLPIWEIAKELGFSSSASFAYAFRRATGLRPGAIGSRQSSTHCMH